MGFAQTLLQGVKRACLPPSEELIEDALKSHKEVLSTPFIPLSEEDKIDI